MSQINSFRDLIVYQKAYDVSKEIFEIFKPESTPLRAYLLYIIRNSLINAGHSVVHIKHRRNRRCILSPKGSILLQCEAKQGEEGDSLIRQYPRDASYSNVV